MKISFSDLIFGPCLYICVGFLFSQPQTYIRLILEAVIQENIRRTYAKGDRCLILSKRSYCIFAPQGFVIKCFLIFIVDEVKNFATNIFFKLVCQSRTGSYAFLVSHVLRSVQKGGVHILRSSEVLNRQKVFIVSSSMGIVKSKDKGFELDLKLIFTIVDCFLGRFPPRFFTVKLVCFISFSGSSYLVLFIFPLHDFDMILMFVQIGRASCRERV